MINLYILNTNKIKGKTNDFILEGFIMRKKPFNINGQSISKVNITNKKISKPIVKKLVFKKYDKLLDKIFNLFLDSDSEDGDNYTKIMDEIEKFRLLIKLNYRHFLNRKDLEMMGSSLKSLQQEAIKNLLILGNVNVIGHNVHRGR